MKRFLKIAGYGTLALFLLLLSAAWITQTDFFRARLREYLLRSAAQSLRGSLHLGPIGGNIVTGFSIDSVAVFIGETPIFTSRRLVCSYNPVALLRREIGLRSTIIEEPSVQLLRSTTGVWNTSQLLKPDSDTTGGGFNWTILLENLELRNASFVLVDSLTLQDSSHNAWRKGESFEYHAFALQHVALEMSAVIRERSFQVSIRHARAVTDRSDFELVHFEGSFLADTSHLSANRVMIQTGHSHVQLDASLTGLNLFRSVDPEKLRDDSARVVLKSDSIDTRELAFFLPSVGFLEGSGAVDLDARGRFGDLAIRRLTVSSSRSSLTLNGSLRNLHHPKDLLLDISLRQSKLIPADIARLMPDVGLPFFDRTAPMMVTSSLKGSPLNFITSTTLEGSFGEVTADGSLDFTDSLPRYALAFSTRRLALERLVTNHFTTTLNTHGTIEGAGMHASDATAELKVRIDSSRIQRLAIRTAEVRISASPGILDGTATVESEGSKASFTMRNDYSDPEDPVYRGNFSSTALDLSTILDDDRYASSINCSGTIEGEGNTVNSVSGSLSLAILPSTFGKHPLDAEELNLSLDQRNQSRKHLSLRSSIIDASVDGKFELIGAISTLAEHAQNLGAAILEHASPPDSIRPRAISGKNIRHTTIDPSVMDFTFDLSVKDLDPIATLLDSTQFDARGTLHGTIRGSDRFLALSGDGSLDLLFIGSIERGILLNHSTISLRVDSLLPYQPLDNLIANISVRAASGLINSTHADSVFASLTYSHYRGTIATKGIIDSLVNVSIAGIVSVQPGTYVFDLEDVAVSSGDVRWVNDQDLQIRLNTSGLRVLHAVLYRGDEFLTLSGFLRQSGDIAMSVTLEHFNLDEVNVWLDDPDVRLPGQGFAGTGSLHAELGGSLKAPVIALSIDIDSAYFRQTRLGVIHSVLSYGEQNASIDVAVRNSPTDTTKSLMIHGTVPIDLAFEGAGERFPKEEQHLEINSDGFDVSVLDPLINELQDLSGKLLCHIVLSGTPRDPRYSGSLTLRDVQFVFTPNNIAYTLNGTAEPDRDRMILKDVVIRNLPSDLPAGEAHVSGSMKFSNFRLSNFDLVATGQLLVLSDASRKAVPTMYGTLVAGIDPQGLDLKGSWDEPYLSGTINVMEANMIFPPARIGDTRVSTSGLTYVMLNDTLHAARREHTPEQRFFTVTDSGRALSSRSAGGPSTPLLERIRYNLTIETHGTTAIRMIFTPSTNEELYAEIEGKVIAVHDQGLRTIYGTIDVTPRSYYNFIQKFDAKGTLRFIGPWDNPELNIEADYEGVHQKSGADSLSQEKVIVQLTITGTRLEPKLQMTMKVQSDPGKDPVDWSTQARGGDVQSDVISFILTGKFRDELSSQERAGIQSSVVSTTGTSLVSGFTSSLLSGIWNDFLKREFPFIRSLDLSYQGGSFQEGTNIRLSGEAFKGYWRFGGKILNDIGNANVSYLLNLGTVFNSTTVRNLFIELQRRVESEFTEDKKLTNEARLYYRFSF